MYIILLQKARTQLRFHSRDTINAVGKLESTVALMFCSYNSMADYYLLLKLHPPKRQCLHCCNIYDDDIILIQLFTNIAVWANYGDNLKTLHGCCIVTAAKTIEDHEETKLAGVQSPPIVITPEGLQHKR